MRVLIAEEFSGVIRRAFRAKGHDAYSCDLLPAADGEWAYHKQMSIWHLLSKDPWWDLVIAHPPCTRLAVSGARWWKDFKAEQDEAIEFFIAHVDIADKWCIENPVGIMSSRYRKPDQIVQPWMFGHGETKATCLWLGNLPPLKPTIIVDGREPRVHYESPGVKNGLTRQQRRSITYEGIAQAMAEQWG